MSDTEKCRCGWDGVGEHPCHGRGYTCKDAAKKRFYAPTMNMSLAGAQMKASVLETYSCDKCWTDFARKYKAYAGILPEQVN